MLNNSKFKSILEKMNVENDPRTKKSAHSRPPFSAADSQYRVNKYSRDRHKRKRDSAYKPSIIKRIVGYFNSEAKDANQNEPLLDIKSRFKHSSEIELLKSKLSTNSNSKRASLSLNHSGSGDTDFWVPAEENKAPERKAAETRPGKRADNIEEDVVYQLINKQQQLQAEFKSLKRDYEDLKNEMFLLKHQHSEKNFIDMSLLKEKRKMNNLSDPVVQGETRKLNSNIKKPDLKPMSFEKLSPIKRQESFSVKPKEVLKDSRPLENGSRKANAITSSPSKSYRTRNSNINHVLAEDDDDGDDDDGDDDEEDDWRLKEEDSVSSRDL